MEIPTVRIVVAGDLGTGKSSLINFYVHSIFATEFDSTIEVTHKKQVNINDKLYNIEVVDTVDNEFQNEEQRKLLYQTCDVIILTYAIDDMESFKNLYLRYANLPINEEDGEKKLTYLNGRIKCLPPIIVVGNKTDLEMARQVDFHAANKASKELNIPTFMQCSAATNYNVDELFETAIEAGYKYSQLDHDMTHIYAEEEDSQMRSSDRRNNSSCSSLASRQTMSNNQNSSNNSSSSPEGTFPRNQKGGRKIQRIQSINEDDAVISNNIENSLEQNTQAQTLTTKVSNTKPKQTPKHVSKAETKPTKHSDYCCTIM